MLLALSATEIDYATYDDIIFMRYVDMISTCIIYDVLSS